MFTTKEIVNSDFKTSLTSNRTYYVDGIDVEWVSDDTVVCYIYSKNTTVFRSALFSDAKWR